MRCLRLVLLGLTTLCTGILQANDNCPHRGDLDTPYCDADRNLVADPPTDPRRLKNPDTIVFSYAPVEDPARYELIFKPFTDYLSQCVGKRAVFFQAKSHGAEIDAMINGRLHVGCFSTGPTAFAVNVAGAVPFAVRGTEQEAHGYHLLLIVRRNSSFHAIADLKGRTIAHTSPSSNSGHMAALVLFPRIGLVPDKDYRIAFSGRHDQSVLGVQRGDYDAATVASDVFYRLVARGAVALDDFRILYKSAAFPTESFAYAHDLEPKFRDRLLQCFYQFRYPKSMQREFGGADRFVPINYQKDWALVRDIAQASGENYSRAAYDKEARKSKP